MKAKYTTEINNGIEFRIKHWIEYFEDESTGELIEIPRKRPIKRNGVKCNQFGNCALVIDRHVIINGFS